MDSLMGGMMRQTGTVLVLAQTALTTVVLGLLAATPAAAQTPSPGAASPDPVIERALESRTKGAPDAEVVVFEIADFQCPYCARFSASVAPELDERYVRTGRVQWVFVNMPLHTHPLAWHAAEAALCAGVAGDAFWPMHDLLFEEQQSWSRADNPTALFEGYAQRLEVAMPEYRTCVAEDQVASLILQDVGSSVSARVDGTPTFIIMKGQQVVQRMVGVQSPEEWAEVLDQALR